MKTNCRIQLLLPKLDGVGSQALVAFMHEVLTDGLDLIDDNITVALGRRQNDQRLQSVSVMYNGERGFQIHLNDDESLVKADCEKWCRISGTDLPDKERNDILTCKHRLDVFCDSDPARGFAVQFDDLIIFLRLIFDSCYVYDPIQSKFLLD